MKAWKALIKRSREQDLLDYEVIDHKNEWLVGLEVSIDVRMSSTCLILSNIMMDPSLHLLKHKTPCHEVVTFEGVPIKTRCSMIQGYNKGSITMLLSMDWLHNFKSHTQFQKHP